MIDYVKSDLTELERFLLIDCRQIILTILKNGSPMYNVTTYKLNHVILSNFYKYDYIDYLKINNGKSHKYLSHKKCVDILEKNGYKLDIKLTLS